MVQESRVLNKAEEILISRGETGNGDPEADYGDIRVVTGPAGGPEVSDPGTVTEAAANIVSESVGVAVADDLEGIIGTGDRPPENRPGPGDMYIL